MYLTACLPDSPGHGSSVGRLMYLTVCPPLGLGSIPSHDVIQEIFHTLSILLEPA